MSRQRSAARRYSCATRRGHHTPTRIGCLPVGIRRLGTHRRRCRPAPGLLFLAAVGFAAASFHPPTSSSGHQTAIWIVVGVVLAAGIAASAVAARSERTSSAMGDADPAMAPEDTG